MLAKRWSRVSPRDRPIPCRASKPTSTPGSSRPITPRAACAITSICWRSTAAAWRRVRWPPAPPPRSCTICAIPSAPRSIIWNGRRSTIAPTRWCSTPTTVRNLELVEPLFAGESKESTLLHVLDRTRTGMGGRLLRRRLLAPSIDVAEIEARLDAVRGAARVRHLARGPGQGSRIDSRSGAAAGEDLAFVGRPARSAGAGALAGGDPGSCSAHSLQRGAAADIHGRLDPNSRGSRSRPVRSRRRAARESRRRRHYPRWLRPEPGRAARHLPQQPHLPGPDRAARAHPHRHRIAQSPLQQRLRILHRDFQSQSASGAAPITSASRPWSTPSVSPRRSSRNWKSRSWKPKNDRSPSSARSSSSCALLASVSRRAHQSHGGGGRRAGCHGRSGRSRRGKSLRAPPIF